MILTLEPKRQKNRKAITRNKSSKGRSSTQRLSCFCFRCSASNVLLSPTSKVVAAILRAKVSRAKCGFTLGRRRLGKSLGKVPWLSGSRRCTLEDFFQIVIMVDVDPRTARISRAFQLTPDEAIFPTGVRPQRQSTVSPELSLGPEAIGSAAERSTKRRGWAVEGICRSNLMAGCFGLPLIVLVALLAPMPLRRRTAGSRVGTSAYADFAIFASHSAGSACITPACRRKQSPSFGICFQPTHHPRQIARHRYVAARQSFKVRMPARRDTPG